MANLATSAMNKIGCLRPAARPRLKIPDTMPLFRLAGS
jgi:hypothetical protein